MWRVYGDINGITLRGERVELKHFLNDLYELKTNGLLYCHNIDTNINIYMCIYVDVLNCFIIIIVYEDDADLTLFDSPIS